MSLVLALAWWFKVALFGSRTSKVDSLRFSSTSVPETYAAKNFSSVSCFILMRDHAGKSDTTSSFLHQRVVASSWFLVPALSVCLVAMTLRVRFDRCVTFSPSFRMHSIPFSLSCCYPCQLSCWYFFFFCDRAFVSFRCLCRFGVGRRTSCTRTSADAAPSSPSGRTTSTRSRGLSATTPCLLRTSTSCRLRPATRCCWVTVVVVILVVMLLVVLVCGDFGVVDG